MISGDPARRTVSLHPTRRVACRPGVEGLEGRELPAALAPSLVMDTASTRDSKGVTVEYDVLGADLGQSLEIGIFRSADDRFDPTDPVVGKVMVTAVGQGTPTLDDDGVSALVQGHHRLTLSLPEGLGINPEHPYVLAVADPSRTLSGLTSAEGDDTASFRKYSIAALAHGGIQPKSWKLGVPWELRMASSLRAEGYDAVIPYNWVSESRTPGAAEKQGPRLGRKVLEVASQAPAGEPVDLHFIGHSQGTVVNSVAIRYVSKNRTSSIDQGYLKATLLDPHAANNDAPGGEQYSVAKGLLGTIARWTIEQYQSRADDPLPVVTADVDSAEVFYQRTPIAAAIGSNDGLYNLWGQVPVPVQGNVPIQYYNLTGVGISHGGAVGVMDWYQAHVVPTLGDAAPFTDPGLLNGGLEGGGETTEVREPSFQGEAAPGAEVIVLGASRSQADQVVLGRTVAEPDGSWSVTSRPLPNGTYRVVAKGNAVADPKWPRVRVLPRARLGTVIVDAPR